MATFSNKTLKLVHASTPSLEDCDLSECGSCLNLVENAHSPLTNGYCKLLSTTETVVVTVRPMSSARKASVTQK